MIPAVQGTLTRLGLLTLLLVACRPQPTSSLALEPDAGDQAEPSGLGDAPAVIAEAPGTVTRNPGIGPELDISKVDDRLASVVQATGQARARVEYDADHPWVGASIPMVTIVVFSDYQCPYCEKLDQTLGSLQTQYRDDLRIVWRQMPLPMHKNARLAAKAALAAHAQGGFASMHGFLFDNSTDLTLQMAETQAAALGLDVGRFREDLDSAWIEARIAADEALAKHLHVTGTPAFFVNGRAVTGAQPVEQITTMIEEERQLGRDLVAAGSGELEVWARIMAVADPNPTAPTRATPRSGPDGTKRYAVDLKGVARRGSKKAKIDVLMCGDLDCPFSSRSVATLAQLETANKNKLAVWFRHNPLDMHPTARAAHRAVIAAERQGEFWAMWELVFANQQSRSIADLEGFASQVGLDLARYRKDIADPDVDKQIDADIAACKALDVVATPTFFVNGRALQGAQPIEKFQLLVDEEKAGKGPAPAAKP